MRQFPAVRSARLGQPAELVRAGVLGAAASIFFAYVGFDAVSTAAEETKNPQRNVPIGLIGEPAHLHRLLSARRRRRDRRLSARSRCIDGAGLAVRGRFARAVRVGRLPGRQRAARLLEGSAGLRPAPGLEPDARQSHRPRRDVALPSVVLMMMFGQTRMFFVMARDGLLPERLSSVHPQVPHAVHRDHRHRHRRRHRRGLPAGRHARRLFECRDLVRLRDGRARGDDPAQDGSGPRRPFRTPALCDRRAAGDRRLPAAVPQPAVSNRSCCSSSWTRDRPHHLFRSTAIAAATSAAASSRCRSSLPTRRGRSALRRCRVRRCRREDRD